MGRLSTRRVGSSPRYESERGVKHCRENRLCVECGVELQGRRRRWCSQACVDNYQIRAWPSMARRFVHDRDRGVCAECGLDTDALRARIRESDRGALASARAGEPSFRRAQVRLAGRLPKQRGSVHCLLRAFTDLAKPKRIELLEPHGMESWWWRKTWWDADHVVAVSDGGGQCGVENLRTLCLRCHAERSGRQARARSTGARRVRRIVRRPEEECSSGCKLGDDDVCSGCLRYRKRVLGCRA